MSERNTSIRKAARAVGKRHEAIREMVDSGEVVARIDGGTKEHPRLMVSLDEVREALSRRIYRPVAKPARKKMSGMSMVRF